MPINAVKLRPGIVTDYTPTLNEAGFSVSNLIRWKDGLPQKVGGWEKYYSASVGSIPRALHSWQNSNNDQLLAVGATASLATITSGILTALTPQTLTSDIAPNFSTVSGSATVTIIDANATNVTLNDAIYLNTPVDIGGLVLIGAYAIQTILGANTYTITAASLATSTVNNAGAVPAFTTTNGSSSVSVALTAHGRAVGDTVVFTIATSVGGLTVDGIYTIATVPTANTFTITAANQASSGATVAMNGGLAQILYYIAQGPPAVGVGYGLGGYGDGGYGLGTVPTGLIGTPITATDWSLDNWGEVLMACPSGGGIYYWSPTSGFTTAKLIEAGPIYNGGIFVAMPAQILVAWGSTTAQTLGETQDPLLVKWSDQLDYFNWTVDTTTQAGSFHIPTGSKIVGARQAPNQALIWTDVSVWAMQYIGQPLVFGFNEIGRGCGLVGQHATAILRGQVFWMNQTNFYTAAGTGVQVLPCPVWDTVFQDLDTANQTKCFAWSNSVFNEVWFFYPSLTDATGECSRYVKFNMSENAWDTGLLARSAGIDQGVLGNPIAATSTGLIYQHESGNDADGQPINAYFETGYFMLGEGTTKTFVDLLYPDMKWGTVSGSQGAQINVTFTALDTPNGMATTKGPYLMTNAITSIPTRLRGRQINMRVESNDVGSFWRLGSLRYRYAPDGRR